MTTETILVIEDNETNMKLVRAVLDIAGFKVLEAEDAESGIEIARKSRPTLILMDIQLPGMDGLHATKIIKSDHYLKDIPVVALTAFAMEGDEQKVRDAGCDGYISKPINTRIFADQIRKIIKES